MGQIVLLSESIVSYLNNLVEILYHEGYFSFKENAQDYANKIYDAIISDLPRLTHHETPKKLKKYGNYFVKIKGSKRTMWYVFFDKSENRYLVEFLTNNHMPHSEYLNKL